MSVRAAASLIHDEEDPFGPGMDLIVSLVAFLLLVLAVAALFYRSTDEDNRKLRQQLEQMRQRIAVLQEENERQRREIERLNKIINSINRFPPNIYLKESEGFKFATGQAVVTSDMEKILEEKVISQLHKFISRYPIDTIVVIGHTDGQAIGAQVGNVDSYAGFGSLINLIRPGSNVDLGMMRALAVASKLREMAARHPEFGGTDLTKWFRVYSAGPFLDQNGWAPADRKDDVSRRRIEIRFSKERNNPATTDFLPPPLEG